MQAPLRSHRALAIGSVSLVAVLALTASTRALNGGQGGADVPFEFQAGQPARASEVNQNFAALVGQLAALQDQVDDLESRLALAEESTQFMSVSNDELNGLAGPHLIVEGVNLHVRSGSGATDDGGVSTGLGNLVIGYNEEATGQAGGDRDGAHNLVVGREHLYTTTGGIVAGEENDISGAFAVVLGGTKNSASGSHAVVGGGAFNQASGVESCVSGGVSNFASAQRASISGGAQNTANGIASSISGGSGGATGGFASSISGGQSGIASGDNSSITGGQSNAAFGNKSAVSGGFNIAVTDDFDWAACDLSCQ